MAASAGAARSAERFWPISLARCGADREAVAGERDGRRHQDVARQAREALARGLEAGDLARYRDGEPAAARQLGQDLAVASIEIAMGERRRGLAIVERAHVAVGLVHQHEAAAADAARRGVQDADGVGGRDRGVDGVAAALEHREPDLGGARMLGGDGAATAFGAARGRASRRAAD